MLDNATSRSWKSTYRIPQVLGVKFSYLVGWLELRQGLGSVLECISEFDYVIGDYGVLEKSEITD